MKPRQRRHNRAQAEQQAARRWARAPVHTYRPECIESRVSLGRAFANGRGEVISCKYNSLFSRVECRMSRYGLLVLSTFIQSIGSFADNLSAGARPKGAPDHAVGA